MSIGNRGEMSEWKRDRFFGVEERVFSEWRVRELTCGSSSIRPLVPGSEGKKFESGTRSSCDLFGVALWDLPGSDLWLDRRGFRNQRDESNRSQQHADQFSCFRLMTGSGDRICAL